MIYLPLFLFLVLVAICSSSGSNNRVMVWLCLEFCDETPEQIRNHLVTIERHKDVLSAVSFEKYTLGPNSTLVDNELTEVSFQLNEIGVETWPLLSSFPHPDEFIDWMRQVFDNPQPFISSCIQAAKKYNYVGWNLDWEPTGNDVTDEDGLNYAKFIDTFAKALHDADLKLTVDYATWSPIWNVTAMAETAADKLISMGTYTSTDSAFTHQLEILTDAVGGDGSRAGVGLETVNASTSERIPMDEVIWRFNETVSSGAQEIDIWRMPVPPLWWPLIENFVQIPSSTHSTCENRGMVCFRGDECCSGRCTSWNGIRYTCA